MKHQFIKVYTDGSCHTQKKIGTWAALIYIGETKHILSGFETDTSHNRMELLGILKAIEYLKQEGWQDANIAIYTDSQYAVKLQSRREKLELKGFQTKKGNAVRNSDLVKALLYECDVLNLEFHKVKAHQLDGDIFNREVDYLVRTELRKLTQA